MSKPQSKAASKPVTLSQEFLRAAAGNEESALAYMLLNAFGITLEECMAIVDKAIANSDSKIIVMMMAAGVQVRGNVVFVGKEYANVRVAYPALVIEGDRDVKDVFNFSALHICGHLLAHATSESIGDKVLGKGGDCVLGRPTLTSAAGEINKEIFSGWSEESKAAVVAWDDGMTQERRQVLDTIVARFTQLNAEFLARLKPAVTRPVTAPTTAASVATVGSTVPEPTKVDGKGTKA